MHAMSTPESAPLWRNRLKTAFAASLIALSMLIAIGVLTLFIALMGANHMISASPATNRQIGPPPPAQLPRQLPTAKSATRQPHLLIQRSSVVRPVVHRRRQRLPRSKP
jgi:hypothetical protein